MSLFPDLQCNFEVANDLYPVWFILTAVKMYCGKPRWLQREVKGVLLDITGVLYNGGEKAEEIPDSIKAVQR